MLGNRFRMDDMVCDSILKTKAVFENEIAQNLKIAASMKSC